MTSELSTQSILYNTYFNNSSYNSSRNFTGFSAIEDSFEYALWQKILFGMFMFPIMVFSVLGNVLVVVAICKNSNLQITNNFFLASLAIADCAVGILAMPPNAIQLLTGRWYLKSFMCKFWFSCDVLFSTASILHLCCVSFDRYSSIRNTFEYHAEDPAKSPRVKIMIGSVWILSALVSFVPIFTGVYTTSEQIEIIAQLDNQNGHCYFIVNLPYRLISSFLSFWIPGILMIIFYAKVMKKANDLERTEYNKYKNIRNSVYNTNDPTEGQSLNPESHFTSSQPKMMNKRNSGGEKVRQWNREYKALKTLGTVILVFILCWVFFFLRYTLCDLTLDLCPDFIARNHVLEDVLFWVGYFNSMINPFLYNFTNPDFRNSFKEILFNRF